MYCLECKGKNVRKRKTFTHGTKSKGKISLSCIDCGSGNIGVEQKRNFRRKRF